MHLIRQPICPFQLPKEIITSVLPLLGSNYVTNLDIVRILLYDTWRDCLLFTIYLLYIGIREQEIGSKCTRWQGNIILNFNTYSSAIIF